MQINRTLLTALALVAACLVHPAAADEFPKDWYWDRPDEHTKFEGQKAPKLTVGEWVGGEFDVEKMRGNIVVIDFWATWCGPCIAAMPHNTKLAKEYADDGVKFIGVCTSGDPDKMPGIVKENKAKYPNAFAKGEQVAKDWPIQWYPTYAVVDKAGIVRAIGLKPDRVKDVIETLLWEDSEGTGKARIKASWREGSAEKRERLKQLEEAADKPPALSVKNWVNTDALKLEDLKGKVVVIDFWATWAGPSIKAIPRHNEMLDKYGPEGLVIIGVCATLGSESLGAIIEKHGIRYPVCIDVDNKTTTAYGPNGFPDYYIIDKNGKLRIADCTNASLEDAVVALLGEPMQEDNPEAEGEEAGEAEEPEAEGE